MIPPVPAICAWLTLFIGSLTDLKTREVPDTLSYLFITSGLFYWGIISALEWSALPFLYSLAGLALMLSVSLLLFYTGQWGGGDSKLLIGLGAWLGLNFLNLRTLPVLVIYLVNLMVVGGIYGLAWSIYLMLKHRHGFYREYTRLATAHKWQRRGVLILILFFVLLGIVLPIPLYLRLLLPLPAPVLGLGFFLWLFVKAVENTCFYKYIPPSRLTEGDWVVEEIRVKGKPVVKPGDFGVTKAQILALREMEEKGIIKRVRVKEGVPFVPTLWFAFMLTLWQGAWFLTLAGL